MLILKFGADWCAPCRQVEPVLAAVAEAYPDALVMDFDIDALDNATRAEFEIRAVPTVFVNGVRSVGGPAVVAALKALL